MQILALAPLQGPLYVLLFAVVIPAAIFDYRSRRIPNWLCVMATVAGLTANLSLSGKAGMISALTGFAAGFCVYFGLYLLHAMGAGDVKLMAALGMIVGLQHWVFLFMTTAVSGAVIGIILAARKGRLTSTLWNVTYILREILSLRAPWLKRSDLDVNNPNALRLPHAVSIAVGAALAGIIMVLSN